MKSLIGMFYQLEVRDKNGKVVRKTRLRRSKSFCLAFLQLMEVRMSYSAVTIKDTLGAAEVTDEGVTVTLACLGDATDDLQGLLLGIGTTPHATDDYVMETKIAHGSGAGQLVHGSTSFIPAAEVGPNVDFQIVRAFTNGSGGTINVTEAGIYATMNAGKFGLIVHDVFTAVPVLDTETITATYTFRTTV